jgi:hypothetical protein
LLLEAEVEMSTETGQKAELAVLQFLKSHPSQPYTLFELETTAELKQITLDNIKDATETLANFRRIVLVKKGHGWHSENAYAWLSARSQPNAGALTPPVDDNFEETVLVALQKGPVTKTNLFAKLKDYEDVPAQLRSLITQNKILSFQKSVKPYGRQRFYSLPK